MSHRGKRPTRGRDPRQPVLLAMGDSVMWGEGLLKADKFCYEVAKALSRKSQVLRVDNLAHAGATIASGNGPDDVITAPGYFSPNDSATGEIPRSKPTVLEQCAFYRRDPDAVRYVLIDGGINDVGVNNIVSPLYTIPKLEKAIIQHCQKEMTALLTYVAEKFRHPDCRIIVTGYFPILSGKSAPDKIPQLLMAWGVPAIGPIEQTIDLALDFWRKSDDALASAVKAVNDERIVFVSPKFTEENSLFTGKKTLLREDPFHDKVHDARIKECLKYPQDPEGCLTCPVASIGHPIEAGARQYKDAILNVLL